jgi:hypothetical protein
MPVTVKRVGSKFRIVEAKTKKIAKNSSGTAVDGGGHKDKANAVKQSRAINRSLSKRRK